MTTQPGPEWLRSVARSAAYTLTGRVYISEAFANELAAAWEAERAEAEEIRQLGMRYMVDLASMTARAERAEAALEQLQDALSVRDHQYLAVQAQIVALRAGFAMYSKIDGDDGLASANRLLAACERGDGIDQHAAPDIMAARAEIVAQRAALADKQRVCAGLVEIIETNQAIDEEHCSELDAAKAALERARALEAKWRTLAAQSPTLFVHLGPAADELAAALGSGGAA